MEVNKRYSFLSGMMAKGYVEFRKISDEKQQVIAGVSFGDQEIKSLSTLQLYEIKGIIEELCRCIDDKGYTVAELKNG